MNVFLFIFLLVIFVFLLIKFFIKFVKENDLKQLLLTFFQKDNKFILILIIVFIIIFWLSFYFIFYNRLYPSIRITEEVNYTFSKKTIINVDSYTINSKKDLIHFKTVYNKEIIIEVTETSKNYIKFKLKTDIPCIIKTCENCASKILDRKEEYKVFNNDKVDLEVINNDNEKTSYYTIQVY